MAYHRPGKHPALEFRAAEAASMRYISGYEAFIRSLTPMTVGVANRLGTVVDARCRHPCPATVRPG
ncbi:hypothetical protein GBZ26_03850 [Azospirillum formosense]|uniref:Uncharacterized protein n=1 Tax=Azospirillum formosense TaxID=861533 RepID=A0ABX2KRP2_9PROT|nr:hypothetical protein [Azospirillum formosense]